MRNSHENSSFIIPGGSGSAAARLSYPAYPGWDAQLKSDETIASLDPVQGLVQQQTSGDDPADPAAWQTVTARILIAEGDRIRTGSDGLAYLTFFEGIDSEIGADTLVVVSTLDLPDDQDASFNLTMDVLVGSTITNVEAVLDTNDRFEIHTPSATAAVRGTRWWTVVQPDGTATFSTERGMVHIFPHPPRMVGAAAVAPAPAPDQNGEEAVASVTSDLTAGRSLSADRFGGLRALDRFTPPERPRPAAIAERTCGDGLCRPRERATCPADCVTSASLPSCGNGICESGAGEGLLTCGEDCGPYQGESCGNGTCDADESGLTCAADCQPGQYFTPVEPSLCGNSICDLGESALNCRADCHRDQSTASAPYTPPDGSATLLSYYDITFDNTAPIEPFLASDTANQFKVYTGSIGKPGDNLLHHCKGET